MARLCSLATGKFLPSLLIGAGLAHPQGVITTVAGTDWTFPKTSIPAVAAPLGEVRGVAADSRGNVFLTDRDNQMVMRVSADGALAVVAGNGQRAFAGDGGPATSASLSYPGGVAVDAAGSLYIADSYNNRVRKVTREGVISTVAGAALGGFSGDGGEPTQARLSGPKAAAVDSSGRLYIADTGNNRIRMVGFDAAAERPAISSVVNGASFERGIGPSTWVTITGKFLSRSTRVWESGDFVNGQLPTELDGVRVNINRKPAYAYYISPTQINALSGADDTQGLVSVEVVTAQGRSDPVTVPFHTFAPGFFTYPAKGRKYVTAHTAGGEFIGPPDLVEGLVTRPARQDEVITIYGTGLGPTEPPVSPGLVVTEAARLAAPVEFFAMSFGRRPEVGYAGLIGSGLYQLNITLPVFPDVVEDGDQPIRVRMSNSTSTGDSQSDLWIPIRR